MPYAILFGPVKALTFTLKLVATIAAGGAALAGAVVLLGPASRPLEHAATPIGQLDLTINAPPARSIVYDRNGNVIASFATLDRSPVKLNQVSQVLIDAVLSIEDRKFYEHHGVDIAGTIRALFKNVDAGAISQGGSTITQQLVKNVFGVGRKRDIKEKAREAILAIKLEQQISKTQILEDYLNLVYFGNGAYGVQAAVERYFPGSTLQNLDIAQAALLAGLIQSPSGDDPIKHPGAAARRRSEVLDAMVANHKATPEAAHLAKYVPLPTTVSYPHPAVQDYYTEEVKNILLNDDPTVAGDPAEALGSTLQTRANALYRGGLQIYTAYDPTLQFEANAAMSKELPKSPFTASMVVIDNADGSVRAIANGRTFAEMQYDPATDGQGRPAGSSFKTFTLAAALSRGYTANDPVSGESLSWDQGPEATPHRYYNVSGGDCSHRTLTLTEAIAFSDNCAFVRTETSLGPGNYGEDGVKVVDQMASAMGIDTSKFSTGVSTTLGTNDVHPLDMAQAYSVFPNDGMLRRATFVTKIVDRTGKTIYQAPTNGTRVLDPNVARTEIAMLKHVMHDPNGTAYKSLNSFTRPAAGKTGTTDDNADAWFVGFTPQYTAAVWMGSPFGEVSMSNVGGIRVFGATYPALIWRAFMEQANAPLPPIDFQQPNATLFTNPHLITEFGRRTASLPAYHAPAISGTTQQTAAPTTAARRRRRAPAPTRIRAPAPVQTSPPNTLPTRRSRRRRH